MANGQEQSFQDRIFSDGNAVRVSLGYPGFSNETHMRLSGHRLPLMKTADAVIIPKSLRDFHNFCPKS